MESNKRSIEPKPQSITDVDAIAQIPHLKQVIGYYGEPLRKKVELIYGESLHQILLAGMDPMREVGNKTQRSAFIEHIYKVYNTIKRHKGSVDPDHADKATISLSGLLGPDGVDLYKKAIEEEVSSPAFLYAVANKAAVFFEGPRLLDRVWVWEGGCSGSGKSFSGLGVIRELLKYLPNAGDNNNDGNFFVFIDGGIAREQSQMRKLALITALRCGYSGISDLHKLSGALDIKHQIKKTAIESERVSGIMVLDTFSKCYFDCKQMTEALEVIDKKRMIEVFSEVVPPENKTKEFTDNLVPRMASERSWSRNYGVQHGSVIPFSFNASLPCESKKPPEPISITRGLNGTAVARGIYMKNANHPIHLVVVNDLMYEGSVRLSTRDYKKYLDMLSDTPTNLESWVAEAKKKGLLAPPLVKVNAFDTDPLHSEYFALLNTADRHLQYTETENSARNSKSRESLQESRSGSPSLTSRSGSLSAFGSRSSSTRSSGKKNSPDRFNILSLSKEEICAQIINRLVAFVVSISASEISNSKRQMMSDTIGERVALLLNAVLKNPLEDEKKFKDWIDQAFKALDNADQKFSVCKLLIQNWKTQIEHLNIPDHNKIPALQELHLIASVYLSTPNAAPDPDVAQLLKGISQQIEKLRPVPAPRQGADNKPKPPPRQELSSSDNIAVAQTNPVPPPRASTATDTAPKRPANNTSNNPYQLFSKPNPHPAARPAQNVKEPHPPKRPDSTFKK